MVSFYSSSTGFSRRWWEVQFITVSGLPWDKMRKGAKTLVNLKILRVFQPNLWKTLPGEDLTRVERIFCNKLPVKFQVRTYTRE
ncbi:MAG: hypothetical protein AVDCRST_MAG56-1087 [uncultured Cytophagales bacterium]|uniref:Uncharacterized protein n=1 Tax=uncultured Cytophagales bacterium TaxID=158755 RepID=A0A6J4HUR0_9SPHI|nr:MAG: hypothetical protein AVDCRST_MAG56-1087 [uncultured Cytophagales bacterium]